MPFFKNKPGGPFYRYGVPVLVLALNLVLKTAFLGAQDISHDEPFTIYHAQFDVSRIIHFLKDYNNPPLYELILHYWIKLSGISAFYVRVLPCLFGALSAVVLYRLGLRFFSFSVGLISSLLYTFSTMSVYYSHDCRAYTLFLLLTLCSMYLYLSLSDRPYRRLSMALLVLVNALLIYAHYFGFIVLFIQSLHVLISNRSFLKRLIGINAFTLLLYIPQVLVVAPRLYVSASQGTWVQEPMGAESLYNMLWSFSNAPVATVLCLTLLVAALCVFIYRRPKISSPAMLLAIWFLLPFIGMFLISYKMPIYLDRYLVFALPAYYLSLACGLRYVFKADKYRVIASVLLIGIFAFTVRLNPDKKRRVADMISYIKANKDPNTLVLVCSYDFLPTFAYYYNPAIFKSISGQSEYGQADSLLKKDNIIHLHSVTDIDPALFTRYKKITYVNAGTDFSALNESTLALLQEHGQETGQAAFYSIFDIRLFDVNGR